MQAVICVFVFASWPVVTNVLTALSASVAAGVFNVPDAVFSFGYRLDTGKEPYVFFAYPGGN